MKIYIIQWFQLTLFLIQWFPNNLLFFSYFILVYPNSMIYLHSSLFIILYLFYPSLSYFILMGTKDEECMEQDGQGIQKSIAFLRNCKVPDPDRLWLTAIYSLSCSAQVPGIYPSLSSFILLYLSLSFFILPDPTLAWITFYPFACLTPEFILLYPFYLYLS